MHRKNIPHLIRNYLRLLLHLIQNRTLPAVIRTAMQYQWKRKEHQLLLESCLSLFTSSPSPGRLPAEILFDIIIPVYNGYEYLEKLFQSIFAHTRTPFRLILIDDCSTDKRVTRLLKQIYRKNPARSVLIKNQTNLGFVKSVNRGYALTDNHFVILNTDTEVPPMWIERLMRPILENDRIASTTPFSNAADMYSFPGPSDSPELFAGLQPAELDTFFHAVDTGKIIIDIPTGVGFCMGINKNAANRIGLFDEEQFGQGYCEENDWCMRAKAAGYRNILVPNLFLYHKLSGSFSHEKKQKLMAENYWKLAGRHPNFIPEVFEFSMKDPLRPIRCFLMLIIAARKDDLKPILVVENSGISQKQNRQAEKMIAVSFNNRRRLFEIHFQSPACSLYFLAEHVDTVVHLLEWIPVSRIVTNSMEPIISVNELKSILDGISG